MQTQNYTFRFVAVEEMYQYFSIAYWIQTAIVNTDRNVGEEQNRIQIIKPEDDGRCTPIQYKRLHNQLIAWSHIQSVRMDIQLQSNILKLQQIYDF